MLTGTWGKACRVGEVCSTVVGGGDLCRPPRGRLIGGDHDVSRHEQQDDKDKYTRTGHRPGPIPAEDPGGKHGKPDDPDDKDHKDDKDTGK